MSIHLLSNILSLFNQITNYKSNKMRRHWSTNRTVNLSLQKYTVFVKVCGTHFP